MTDPVIDRLAKYREQIRIARETGTFVVQTADEAQAVVNEIDGMERISVRRVELEPSRWDDDDHAH